MKYAAVILCALIPVGDTVAQTTSYSYDALGRLTTSQRSDGVTTQYTLDNAGNRTHVTTSGASSGGGITLADASFEQPAIGNGNYAYNPTAPGVSFIGNTGLSANSGAWGFTAPDGQQVAFLQYGNSRIVMSYSGATPGASYRVTFLAALRPGYSHTFSVVSAGQTLATISAGLGFSSFSTGTFTATQSAGTIEFNCANPGYDGATGIDQVQIVPA